MTEPAETKPRLRVRIVHDDSPSDPRGNMDMMCEIREFGRWRSAAQRVVELIRDTQAWMAVERLNMAIKGDRYWDDDLPDIGGNPEIRQQWLEQLSDCLLVHEFHTGGRSHYPCVAHTTPEMCAKLGVDWANAQKAMEAECEMFRQWADGEVYGYVIEELVGEPDEDGEIDEDDDGNWEQVDSCWGFYGDDPFENGMSDHVPKELHEQLRKAEVEYWQ